VDRVVALLGQGRARQARVVRDTRLDLASELIDSRLNRAIAAQDRLADQTGVRADSATWIAAILAAGAFALLVALLVRQRRLVARERFHIEQLRVLDRLKDEFVASVSHELRTPLTSIRGYLELVLHGEAGELKTEQREFLNVVDRNAERLIHIVGDLLDVAQIEAGQLSLDLQSRDLATVVAESVDAALPVAADRRIELELETNGGSTVAIDRERFGQVVDNLLSNALKFTDPGGRVDVRVAAPNEHAVVEVADSGMGIPEEEQAKLFERFFRAEAAGEKAIQGTGLGLWISKAIVEAHGGRIGVASRLGHGTTFRIELPLAKGAA
jgi:signal transduction histidine kinase